MPAQPGRPGRRHNGHAINNADSWKLKAKLNPYALVTDYDVITQMAEDELDKEIEKLVKEIGVPHSYHTYRSTKSPTGFPDRVYIGRSGALVRELKRVPEVVTLDDEQQQWLDDMAAIGWDADYWNPYDLWTGRIARELAGIMRRRPSGLIVPQRTLTPCPKGLLAQCSPPTGSR